MKRVFLLIVVPALLVAMGFAQTPAASGNPDQIINIKGCLAGSEGNYTVAENSTGKIFKITTSSADLKEYVGQDVNLTGHKGGTAENSLAVTEFKMISEHCATAAAAPAATVSTPSETVSTPPAAVAVAPAFVAPEATVSSPPETVIERPTPAAPAATASAPAETASAPPVAVAVPRTRTAARPHKPAATPAAAPAPAEPVSTPVADANRITAPVAPAPETASTPAAAAPKTSTSRSAGMLVSIVVVLLIGAGIPLYNRWRRRKLLEQTRGQNLSFTKEAKSDPSTRDTTGGHKAA